MKPNDQFNKNNPFSQSPRKDACQFSNTLAIYTVIYTLEVIQKNLGLEAMLEYKANFLKRIEKRNPDYRSAFANVITKNNIDSIYKQSMKGEI